MNSSHNYFLLLISCAFIFGCSSKTEYLPIMGPRDLSASGDTIFHEIPSFSFEDQNEKIVSNELVKDKVYCSNFFFTTCRSICPKMNKNLAEVVKEFKGDDRISFLSHSLDPANDSPEILSAYAGGFGVDAENWHFLTGSEKEIYTLAGVGGYFVSALRDEASIDGIDHSGKVALVDKNGRIRAYHDLTDSANIDELIKDIRFLLDEK